MMPSWLSDTWGKSMLDSSLVGYPERHKQALKNYCCLTFKLGGSDNEKLLTSSFKLGGYAIYPLTSSDRLGNSDIPFPIAFAYGDRDWLGSNGADEIVQ